MSRSRISKPLCCLGLSACVVLGPSCTDEPETDASSMNGVSNGPGAGGSSADNVEACEELVDELDCGELDLSMYVDCNLFADLSCDISDYFDCVREELSCVDGVGDVSGLAECAELATCT